ncbi:MAG: UvrD-helicase domain-containing protein [Bacteroidales bacterium]
MHNNSSISQSGNFVVYKASAGSGKTYNLAKEFFKITFANPELFKNILAITFTNKAANEMKTRIVENLNEFISLSIEEAQAHNMLKMIHQESGISYEKMLENSQIVLNKILYNYADFSIMTIDSFYQKILRSFAYDMGIPVNYRLEIELDELIKQLIDRLMSQFGENPEIKKVLIEYINQNISDERTWNVEDEIAKFAKQIFDENLYKHIRKLHNVKIHDYIELIKKIRKRVYKLKKEIVQKAADLITKIEGQGIDIEEDFTYKRRGYGGWLLRLKNEDFSDIGSYAKNAIFNDKWFSAKSSFWGIFEPIKTDVTDASKEILLNLKDLTDLENISKNIYSLALLYQIYIDVEKIKVDDSVFFLSETNLKIYEIIKDQPSPFIYERIGDRYYHYFIDEFQDTSTIQWLNIAPLISEAISQTHQSGHGSAIIFGDEKQSIYRFRGGDFNQILELAKPENTKNLITNFRSTEKVVKFNNEVFKLANSVLGENKYKSIYEDSAQEIKDENGHGYVEFRTIEEGFFDDVFEIIQDALKRNYSQKDIAILSFTHKPLQEIAQALTNTNLNNGESINVVSSDSLKLHQSPKVQFLHNIISFFKNENNPIINAAIILYLCEINNIDSSKHLAISNDKKRVESFIEEISKNKISYKTMTQLNIYELVEEAHRVFFDDKIADPYVSAFINIIYKYNKEQKRDTDFVEWWAEKKDKHSISISENIDGVRLISVHSSKGLEFPIVIMLNKAVRNKGSNIWIDKELDFQNLDYNLPVSLVRSFKIEKNKIFEDEQFNSRFLEEVAMEKDLVDMDNLNSFYVALTRAKEELYLLSEKTTNSSANINDRLIANIEQIEGSNKTEDDGLLRLSWGTPTTKVKEEIEQENVVKLEKTKSNAWDKIWVLNEIKRLDELQEWGNNFHEIMQNIVSIDNVENSTKIIAQRHNIEASKLGVLKNMAKSVCTHPQLEKYFSHNYKVYNEKSILSEDGEVFRPDRIMIKGDNASVIDFKTGTYTESDSLQVEKYIKLLIKLNYKDVKGFLVYVHANNIEVIKVEKS